MPRALGGKMSRLSQKDKKHWLEVEGQYCLGRQQGRSGVGENNRNEIKLRNSQKKKSLPQQVTAIKNILVTIIYIYIYR